MMEVGKKYAHVNTFRKYDGKSVVTVYTCHAILPSGAAVLSWPKTEWSNGGEAIEPANCLKYYKEYVEPKTGTVWINVYDNHKVLHSTREEADEHANKTLRLACVEVSWTEGQGL